LFDSHSADLFYSAALSILLSAYTLCQNSVRCCQFHHSVVSPF